MPVKKKAVKSVKKEMPEKSSVSVPAETESLAESETMEDGEMKTEAPQGGNMPAGSGSAPVRVEVEVEPENQGQVAPVSPTTASAMPESTAVAQDANANNQPAQNQSSVGPDFSPAPGGVELSSGSGGWKKFFLIVLVLIIVGAVVVGGVLIYQRSVRTPKAMPSATPEAMATPTAAPEASAAANLKKGDLNIEVLNGTTTAGYAAKAKEYLQGLGYTNVAVGNADTSDFTTTEIAIKDDKKDYLPLLTADLSKDYALDNTTKSLDASSKYDVVITLGSEKAAQ